MNVLVEAALAEAEGLLADQKPLEAAASFEHAAHLGADPDHCAGRRWICYMLAGEYESAWQQSDAIRARGAADPHRVWNGAGLAGKSVLIRSVHGFGDAVQMLRYTRLLREQVSRLTLQVNPDLVELARFAVGVDEVIAWEEFRPFDVQIEITELAYLFRSTPRTLPGVPYLALSALALEGARRILGERRGLRVGLVWSSSAWDTSRSIPFDLLEPLLDAREDAEFWCLQSESAEWEAFCWKRAWPPRHAGCYSAEVFAGCLAEMDLVITTDSFAAHLAGALARPAWVLLKRQPDWRWMLERQDTPWYPTLRLFRQETRDAWQPVLARAARELKHLSSSRQHSPADHSSPAC